MRHTKFIFCAKCDSRRIAIRLFHIKHYFDYQYTTRKDMALSAISMNSALVDKEFVLSLHHKLHVHVLK